MFFHPQQTVFSTVNNARASNKHVRPPTYENLAHCSPLFLQITWSCLQTELSSGSPSANTRRLSEGDNCSWKPIDSDSVTAEGDEVACCGELISEDQEKVWCLLVDIRQSLLQRPHAGWSPHQQVTWPLWRNAPWSHSAMSLPYQTKATKHWSMLINFPAFSVVEPKAKGSTHSSSLAIFRWIIHNLIHPLT